MTARITIYPYHITVQDAEAHGSVQDINYDECTIALGDDPSHGTVSLQELLEAWTELHPEAGMSFAV